MGDVGAETTADNTVPGRVVHCVKLSFEDLCDVIEDTLFLESVICAINCMLLHLF